MAYLAIDSGSAHRQVIHRLSVKRKISKQYLGDFVSMVLSNKRQNFCRYVVDGLTPTEAYIKAFDVTSERKHTATEAGSRLMKLATIQQQIDTLQSDISDKLASEIVWNKAKIISELAINVELGREDGAKHLATSTRSLELIGKAVGSVFEADQQQISGTVEILHKLPDSVLAKLESLNESGSIDTSNIDSIEASNYQIIEPDLEDS